MYKKFRSTLRTLSRTSEKEVIMGKTTDGTAVPVQVTADGKVAVSIA